MLQSADVVRITGLSRSQLREWTARDRRDILPPDVLPGGTGKNALFEWRTVLVLMILKELRDKFHIELGAWRQSVRDLRNQLIGVPFHALWDCYCQFESVSSQPRMYRFSERFDRSGLTISLEHHLILLSESTKHEAPSQFSLFPAVAVPIWASRHNGRRRAFCAP